MKNELEQLRKEIVAAEENKRYTAMGIEPLFSVFEDAKIVIVGQAPGIKAQQSKMFFNDKSGIKLREWLGVSEDIFYNSGLIAVVPMDFYYPGKGKNGDLPPRKNFASKWHKKILDLMPNIELIILVGAYSQNYYLNDIKEKTLTETVCNYNEYLPRYFPIVHPSPLNFRWFGKNPWFEEKIVPALREKVRNILGEDVFQ
ncbi:uracil-DNA glycosylase family protein [Gemella cuniculi]|uniref:uracil-DNA glycosylase family protein n=1 Tax=Gemella cuniculi TaxID=150240 RepID=UPI0003F89296|nr:uracil-DNA glycosylase family protein [Gemella cuniculi]